MKQTNVNLPDPTRKCKTESQDDCVYASSSFRVGGSRLGFSFLPSLPSLLISPPFFLNASICSLSMIGHGEDEDVARYNFMESLNSGVKHASFPIKLARLSSSASASSSTSSPGRLAKPRVGSNIPIDSILLNASSASRRPCRCIQPSTISPTLNEPPHATKRKAHCRAMSVMHDERSTAAATVGPRGAGSAYMARSIRCGNRSRYSKRDVDVDSSTSCGSEGTWGDEAALLVSGFPLFLVEEGEETPTLFRFGIVCCLRFRLCVPHKRNFNSLRFRFLCIIIYTLDFVKGVNIAQCLISEIKGVNQGCRNVPSRRERNS
mmetsp:Transcript_20776/g.39340  ORF Transcript_20776/g.39340 Transcript_20776/m.39340 type:complete len:320 (-) Transcript_20776:553-1512(-)